jgi:hypothetical protein
MRSVCWSMCVAFLDRCFGLQEDVALLGYMHMPEYVAFILFL